MKRLLAAKADPDGYQFFTPLQYAVNQNREDIVKALIKAGASPEINYGMNPELDKKVERMICRLSSQSQVFDKVHQFFFLSCAARTKKEIEVSEFIRKISFKSILSIHTILFEVYFGVIVPSAEQYRQERHQVVKRYKECRQIH